MTVIRRRLRTLAGTRRSLRNSVSSALSSRPNGPSVPVVPPVPAPWLFAAQNSIIHNSTDTRAYTNVAGYWDYYTASGTLDRIAVVLNNWWASANSHSVVDVTNALPITEMSIEIGGVTAPIVFSGARAKTLAGGDDDVMCDPIPASAFGLTGPIPNGTPFRVKYKIQFPNTTSSMPASSARSSSGGYCIWYDPAAVTVSSVDVPGAFTVTGAINNTNSVTRPFGFQPRIIGQHASRTDEVWVGVGDSITQGLMDSAGTLDQKIRGLGWLYKAIGPDNTGNTRPVAYCNMGVASAMSILATNHPRYRSSYKYATCGTWFHCTNDFALNGTGNTVATCQTRTTQGASLMKSEPGSRITKVLGAKLITRVSSTDNYKTPENQTYSGTGWQPGDRATQFNTWLDTQIGVLFDGMIQWNSVRDATTPTKWKTDGVTNNLTSTDGTHPSSNGYDLMANEARIARVAMLGSSVA